MTISKKTGTSLTSSSASNKAVKLLGSCFGIGYLPRLRDTAGSLAGLALLLLTKHLTAWIQLIIVFVFILLAIGISEQIERIEKCKDPAIVVIDEALGMWISLLLIWEINFVTIAIAFILFRFFDVFKPFPINLFQTFKGGTGIVADDLAAGMLSNLILRLILLRGFI